MGSRVRDFAVAAGSGALVLILSVQVNLNMEFMRTTVDHDARLNAVEREVFKGA